MAASLRRVASRLQRMLEGRSAAAPVEFLNDMDNEDFEVEFTTEDAAATDPEQAEAELARVSDFVTRVDTSTRCCL